MPNILIEREAIDTEILRNLNTMASTCSCHWVKNRPKLLHDDFGYDIYVVIVFDHEDADGKIAGSVTWGESGFDFEINFSDDVMLNFKEHINFNLSANHMKNLIIKIIKLSDQDLQRKIEYMNNKKNGGGRSRKGLTLQAQKLPGRGKNKEKFDSDLHDYQAIHHVISEGFENYVKELFPKGIRTSIRRK